MQKEFTINSAPVTLYDIQELSKRLHRTPQTIRKWERHSVIPPTPFRYGNKRMYLESMIDILVRCAEEEIKDKDLSNFTGKVFAEFIALFNRLSKGEKAE